MNKIGIEEGIWDNHSLECFRNCPQYYYWRIVKGLVKPGAVKTAADFGSAIHLALEHYYKNGMTKESKDEAVEKFVEAFTPAINPADDKRTIVKGIEILKNYFLRYDEEVFNVVATEIGGAVELGDYLYSFRNDLLVEWNQPKGLYGMDHKTTSTLGRMVVKPNNQLTGYIFALTEMYGEQVLGYIMNEIGVYKDDSQYDKNAPKVISPLTGKLVYQKKQRETFIRSFTTRTKGEIEAWKMETLHLISQIKSCHQKGVWPKFTNFCSAFSSKCQYLDLCLSSSEAVVQQMVEMGMYEVEWWTPYVGGDEEEIG